MILSTTPGSTRDSCIRRSPCGMFRERGRSRFPHRTLHAADWARLACLNPAPIHELMMSSNPPWRNLFNKCPCPPGPSSRREPGLPVRTTARHGSGCKQRHHNRRPPAVGLADGRSDSRTDHLVQKCPMIVGCGYAITTSRSRRGRSRGRRPAQGSPLAGPSPTCPRHP